MTLKDEIALFCRDYINNSKERTPERDEKIETVYRQITGKNVRKSCGTCLIEALLEINTKLKMPPCRYRLKLGQRLTSFGNFRMNATNLNLTDELAEWHLRVNPTCRSRFEIIPGETPAPATPVSQKFIQPLPPVVIVQPESVNVPKIETPKVEIPKVEPIEVIEEKPILKKKHTSKKPK